jgi:hypothetical protein
MSSNDYRNANEARVAIVFFAFYYLSFPFSLSLSLSLSLVFDCLLFMFSRRNSGQGFIHEDKLPKVNWSQHANFLSQNKFLSSNFVFSLSSQKPPVEGAMGARYVAIKQINLFLFGCVDYNLYSIESDF